MSRWPSVVLFTGAKRWRLAIEPGGGAVSHTIELAGKPSLQEAAEELRHVLGSAGVSTHALVVAVESAACFSATIETAGLPRRARRTAMLYRLEAKLPLEAENLLADFAVHNGQALAVCIRNDAVEPVLEALEACRFVIAAVVPQAVLALQGSEVLNRLEHQGPIFVLWRDGESAELLEMIDGQPVRWLTLRADPGDVSLAIASQVLSRRAPARVLACGEAGDLWLADLADVQVTTGVEFTPEPNALKAAGEILAGRLSPWFDLRPARGMLASRSLRRPLMSAAVTMALCLMCSIGAMTWRGHRYALLGAAAAERKQQIFQGLFPGRPVPLGVESRLRSALRQLQGGGGPADSVRLGPDAMAALLEVLTRLPVEPRSRITELELSPTRVQVVGEVRSHVDADLIASSLRRSLVIRFDDPQTQQTPHGSVQLSLSGAVREMADARKGATR